MVTAFGQHHRGWCVVASLALGFSTCLTGCDTWPGDDQDNPYDPESTFDFDKDGVSDNQDVFPLDPSESSDWDNDGIGDNADNCVDVANTDQRDVDVDAVGDACDDCIDHDHDGFGIDGLGGACLGADCDDNNPNVHDQVCGDAITCGTENCDDGINDGGAGQCIPGCARYQTCGDGHTDGDETCDDGNTQDSDYCSADCTASTGRCGDNIRQANEICDDGYQNACGVCNADCTGSGTASVCGAQGTMECADGQARSCKVDEGGCLNWTGFVACASGTCDGQMCRAEMAWADRAGGSGADIGKSVSVLSDGSAIVTGYFSATAVFAQGQPGEASLVSAGERDIFIARYNDDGGLAWVRQAGGSAGSDESNAVAVLPDGSALVTGQFAGPAVLGSGETNETSLTGGLLFIAKYNADGTLAWAKKAQGTVIGQGIAAFSDGSAAVTGFVSGTAIFGQGEMNETSLAGGGRDIFVAKYNSDGTVAWAKLAMSSDGIGYRVAALSDGGILATGAFSGTVVFGLGESNETSLDYEGNYDLFVAKYRADGTLLWARRAGGSSSNMYDGHGIAALPDGSAFVTGSFSGTTIFGPGEINQASLESTGATDGYVAKYGSDGRLVWARRFGGSIADVGAGVSALGDDGSAVVTGHFGDTSVFGQDETHQTSLVSSGGRDTFVAKYNADGSLAWAKKLGGNADDVGKGVAALSGGVAFVTGYFGSTATFGPSEPHQTLLTSQGDNDIFVAKYHW